VSEADTRDILKRIEDMVGPEASADKLEVLAEKVGLRPCRPEVRLEMELYQNGTKAVVHNYGHGTTSVVHMMQGWIDAELLRAAIDLCLLTGGGGWSLCWGCAQDVVELVKSNRIAQRSRL